MFDPVGLFVDLVPPVFEGFGQVHLEAVAPNHLEGDRGTRHTQQGLVVAIVNHKPEPSQLPQHLGC